ncbi:beta/gamma crystallin [Ruminiclostridium sufflavum DSM 19573]|uniref:Beta/gamma crystallin n=1 Tax=Ruminiclostridium sufflavum DSM 19573 TaxID=1121337 RepID=A0A318XWP8_9FIRM|nr:Cys-every-fifth RiPP peptide CefA [Ruminiclostridium sufflavum]PYG87227.1 beta/gamma crystallin [Ruminiclostridium sufflavum DSM 19573]
MKVIVQSKSPDPIYKVTVYEHANYGGRSQSLPVGRYNLSQLTIGNDIISSVKIPAGLIVTAYEHIDFKGKAKVFTEDSSYVGNDFNDKISSIVVELAVRIYEHANYQGGCQTLPLGSYNMKQLTIGNDKLSSVKIPSGLVVTLFEHIDFGGRMKTFIEDTPYVGNDFNDITSGIMVSVAGAEITDKALKFGDKISLKSIHNKYMSAETNGKLKANTDAARSWEKFEIVRSGNTKSNIYVTFGDTISLRSCHGKYVVAESDGKANANRDKIGSWERFTLYRSGNTQNANFFCIGDVISLKSCHNKFVVAESNNVVNANRDKIGSWETWTVSAASTDVKQLTANNIESAVCGADACGTAACSAAACGAAACGTAACGAAASGGTACAANVGGAAACGVAVYGIIVCGVAACAADACGAAACAGDVCGGQACGAAASGGAACGGAACGAAACGGAACGGNACSVASCGGDACGGYAGGIAACPADACGANVCGINACPADACAADACAIDIIPIIPGI